MEQLEIIYKPIKQLKPYKKNAKKHPKEQVEKIANSIKEFGFTQPVIVDKDNCVVAGHGRILGTKKTMRLHHMVEWNYCTPKIISDRYRKTN